jgi:ribosomal protein L37AE/L43A
MMKEMKCVLILTKLPTKQDMFAASNPTKTKPLWPSMKANKEKKTKKKTKKFVFNCFGQSVFGISFGIWGCWRMCGCEERGFAFAKLTNASWAATR